MKKIFLGMASALFLMGAAPVQLWSGTSAGFQLNWSDTDLRVKAGNQPAVSLFPPLPEMDPDPQYRCEYDWGLTPLSWVGPYLSYREESNWGCMKAAHPGSLTEFQVKDLRAPNKVLALNQLFPDSEILKALLADTVIREALAADPQASKGQQKFSSTAALLSALAARYGKCEYELGKDMLKHFAFHHIQGQQVAVRIGLSHGCEAARGNLTQLGILLKIPPALKDPLQQALKGKAGFLMGAFETRFKERRSTRKYVEPGMKYPPY